MRLPYDHRLRRVLKAPPADVGRATAHALAVVMVMRARAIVRATANVLAIAHVVATMSVIAHVNVTTTTTEHDPPSRCRAVMGSVTGVYLPCTHTATPLALRGLTRLAAPIALGAPCTITRTWSTIVTNATTRHGSILATTIPEDGIPATSAIDRVVALGSMTVITIGLVSMTLLVATCAIMVMDTGLLPHVEVLVVATHATVPPVFPSPSTLPPRMLILLPQIRTLTLTRPPPRPPLHLPLHTPLLHERHPLIRHGLTRSQSRMLPLPLVPAQNPQRMMPMPLLLTPLCRKTLNRRRKRRRTS
jgi:hypothetical protein